MNRQIVQKETQLCKTLLLDLDNTLYDYNKTHEEALKDTFSHCLKTYNIDVSKTYDESRKKVHSILKGNPSSHNRLLYFQNLCRKERIKEFVAIKLHDKYWKFYYDKMRNHIYPGIRNFLKQMKESGCRIIVVTNFLASYQFQKLRALLLLSFVDHVVSSEEVGVEKPNPLIILHALKLAKCKPSESLFIGDSYEQDIMCAQSVGVPCFWFNTHKGRDQSEKIFDRVFSFNSFETLDNSITNLRDHIDKYIYLSRRFGQRYDMVQAGGGNLSVKDDDFIVVKASGSRMCDAKERNGYVVLSRKSLKKVFLCDSKTSMEIGFHISLPHTYILHLHPILVNACPNFNFIQNSVSLNYFSPGEKLSIEIKKLIKQTNVSKLEVIFLKNHGCIFCSNDFDSLLKIIENTFSKLKQKFPSFDIKKYEVCSNLSMWMEQKFDERTVCFCSEDSILREQLLTLKKKQTQPLTPDYAIYVGFRVCFCASDDEKIIKRDIRCHYDIYHTFPNVVKTPLNIFIFGSSLGKCRDIEQVLKSQVQILSVTHTQQKHFNEEEVYYLNNMPEEKFRKTIK